MNVAHDGDFLYVCIQCGERFFTQGEKDFYIHKKLILPKRCKGCREQRKDERQIANFAQDDIVSDVKISELFEEINDNWSVESTKENPDYFYNIEEANILANGKKSYVIGRKGSGKTAIAQYLCEITDHDVFSEKLSFKNFPFNILYSLDNKREYTAPNQYISIWKYLIYTYVCKKMMLNENISIEVREKLTKLYGENPVKSLNRMIGKWTGTGFGAKILSVGFNYERSRQKQELSWIDAIDVLQQIIMDYCDSAKYFIVFDELDEDYKDFGTDVECKEYMDMLTSLYKAVQDIRNIFGDSKYNILPVVFLRSDIYARLKDSDKNKWHESIVDLEWTSNEIKGMLAHRLCVAMQIDDTDFDTIWHKLFEKNTVRMGNRQARQIPIYDYIERSTEMRPRDFIQYIKECVILSKSRGELLVTAQTVKDADDKFSEYLKNETIDEIFAIMPEVAEIFGLLSTIRKQSFQFGVFKQEHEELIGRGVVPNRDVKQILLMLFDAGVIGNQPTMKGKSIFRFSAKAPRFNFNETMLVHRGLYKALQIL